MASTTFTLRRDPYGKLVMTAEDGQQYVGVAPVRAFPIQAPDEGISLVQGDGKEVAWIDHLDELPEPLWPTRPIISTALMFKVMPRLTARLP